MARRVGFGEAGSGGPGSGGTENSSVGLFRWLLIGFLAIWICGWSTGIFVAGRAFFGPSSQDPFIRAFLIFWLIFALFFWGFVVSVIFRLLRGVPPLEKQSD
jgi:hypothetical protein